MSHKHDIWCRWNVRSFLWFFFFFVSGRRKNIWHLTWRIFKVVYHIRSQRTSQITSVRGLLMVENHKRDRSHQELRVWEAYPTIPPSPLRLLSPLDKWNLSNSYSLPKISPCTSVTPNQNQFLGVPHLNFIWVSKRKLNSFFVVVVHSENKFGLHRTAIEMYLMTGTLVRLELPS